MPIFIPGLPKHLAYCPDGPTGVDAPVDGFSFPIDPDRSKKVRAWEKWASEVLEYRESVWKAVKAGDPKVIAEQRYLLSTIKDPKYFITVWCSMYDTRPENIEYTPWAERYTNGWLPALLHPRQYEMVDWIMETINARGGRANGAISKSREVGATTIAMLVSTWAFLFLQPFSAKCISKEEQDVDMIGDIDSMMERSRSLIIPADGNPTIPSAVLPATFGREHTKHLLIRHPLNRNRIRGHSTTGRATRSGRARLMLIDEGAHMDEGILSRLLTAVMNTAPHLIVMSSESAEHGDEFIEWYRALPPESVFAFNFYQMLYHDSAWFKDMLSRYNEDLPGLYREVLRDAYRGFEGWMYPEIREMEPLPNYIHPKDFPDARIWIGMDPGWADECCTHWVMQTAEHDILLESFESSGKPPEYYAAIIAGILPEEIIETEDYHPLRKIYWAPAVLDLIHWVRGIPHPKAVCGDPSGSNVTTGDSWYGKMVKFWKRHDVQHIPVRINWKNDARSDQGRRNALHSWALSGRLQFSNTPQARATLVALQKSRWDPSRRPRQTEQKNARHDDHSHRRTGMEFIAVNLEAAMAIAARSARTRGADSGPASSTEYDGSAVAANGSIRRRPRNAAKPLTGSAAAARAYHDAVARAAARTARSD